ncbi:MAG: POTRA domain-containing protein [Fibrobacterota bacterium]|nr:POTRA domain-containing protein [Chitinispirillaceae bacterium]
MRTLATCLFLLCMSLQAFTQDTSAITPGDSLTIREIVIQGNKRTDTSIVKHFLKIDTGIVFDSVKIAAARERLKSTDIFSKVDIIKLIKGDGVHLYVILVEGLAYNLYDIGGEYYLRKYGEETFWWRLHLGIEDKNFRGKMESLRLQASIWDWKSISAYWTKPLFPSPWYLSTGLTLEMAPGQWAKIDQSIISGRISVGRKVFSHSRVFLGVIPYHEKREKFTTIKDTVPTADSFSVNSRKETSVIRIDELFSYLATGTDYRNTGFDPSKGWAFYSTFQTNALHPDMVTPYYQFVGDLRFYQPFIFTNHKFATRLQLHMRTKYTGEYHEMGYGAEGSSTRGYIRGQLPLNASTLRARDAGFFSAEYKFMIYQFPPMDVPILWRVNNAFRNLDYRLDGALIFDYCRIAPSLEDLFSIDGTVQSGMGIGGSIRVLVPSLQKTAVLDLVWPSDPRRPRGETRFFTKPIWHLYVDMVY